MRGFKAKALRKIAERIYGKSEPTYAADVIRNEIYHLVTVGKNGEGKDIKTPVINTIRRTDKARILYQKLKGA